MLEKCKICKGYGKVYMSRPTTGPDGLEDCFNCSGSGLLFNFGTFSIVFKKDVKGVIIPEATIDE